MYTILLEPSRGIFRQSYDARARIASRFAFTTKSSSAYLYQLNSLDGTISSFRVEKDGGLVLTQIVTPFGPNPMGAPVGLAAR